jgi:hypothetical protein
MLVKDRFAFGFGEGIGERIEKIITDDIYYDQFLELLSFHLALILVSFLLKPYLDLGNDGMKHLLPPCQSTRLAEAYFLLPLYEFNIWSEIFHIPQFCVLAPIQQPLCSY